MSEQDSGAVRGTVKSLSRRPFVKAIGAGVLSSFAGCSSSGNTSNSTESTTTSGGSETGSTGTTTMNGSSSKPLAGRTAVYWDMMNAQSKGAKTAMANAVQEFQKETGATLKVNWSAAGNIIGGKWASNMKNGQFPHFYTAEPDQTGWAIGYDWIHPMTKYKDQLNEDYLSGTEYIQDTLKYAARGWDGKVPMTPVNLIPRNAFVVRTDHLKQAGLNPDKDFPPKSYDDLIRVAKTLKEKGPSNWGYEMFGANFDWCDAMQPMAMAHGGKDGLVLNDDWSKVQFSNDNWRTIAERYQHMYRDLHLSNPQTPTEADEPQVDLLGSGRVSMSIPEWWNWPSFVNRHSDLLESGKLRWGHFYDGPKNQESILGGVSCAVIKTPDGQDPKKWRKAQEVAYAWINKITDTDFQTNMFRNVGLFPVRDDVREQFLKKGTKYEEQTNALHAGIHAIENSDYRWPSHPQYNTIMYHSTPPYVQKMLKGQLGPDEAMKKATKDAQFILNQGGWA
ncbi:MAG TPA: ABC transporter substrate-binding protein [Halobacteriales archaeon]|nr:ABC transporter substrate-binding protein [Halobacteriales archaeon]